MRNTILFALAATVAMPAAAAMDHRPIVAQMVEDSLRAAFTGPVVIEAVRAQNVAHAGLDQAAIDTLDQKWRQEVKAGAGGGLIRATMENQLSRHLMAQQASFGGLVTEVFVTDVHGLNVGQSEVTSDYWQGDEAKFQEVFPKGPGAVFVDEVELDESTQTLQAQVSFTLVDPDTNAPIGVVTVGVDVDGLGI
jgi:hypothetical protein